MTEAALNTEIDGWKEAVRNARRGTANGKRHPHQPAILLWFVKAASSGNPRLLNWADTSSEWKDAIRAHGGSGSPESPITALVNAKLLESTHQLSRTASSPSARQVLNSLNPKVGLPESLWKKITIDSQFKSSIIDFLASQLD